jgi:hypothetical protein
MLVLVLTGCNLPRQSNLPSTGGVSNPDQPCAYVEARRGLPEVSAELVTRLRDAALPVETARAEAYGENCLAADNSVVRFAARETDFYVTLDVPDLGDEAALGQALEQSLAVIKGLPAGQLGPNPGYIGVTFKSGTQVQNLWFTQTQSDALQAQGLGGAALYQALLNSKP